jgi:hypothetical protein
LSQLPDMQPSQRPVRSFVRRSGRITAAQSRALAELWPRWGIEFRRDADLTGVFGAAPAVMEIGPGRELLAMAEQHPEQISAWRKIGHWPLPPLTSKCLTNVRLIATTRSSA